jgi:hypothetical protein
VPIEVFNTVLFVIIAYWWVGGGSEPLSFVDLSLSHLCLLRRQPTPPPSSAAPAKTTARPPPKVSLKYHRANRTPRFGGLNRNAADFFANLGTMILVVLVAESWGLLLGGAFMNAKKAQTATTGEC